MISELSVSERKNVVTDYNRKYPVMQNIKIEV